MTESPRPYDTVPAYPTPLPPVVDPIAAAGAPPTDPPPFIDPIAAVGILVLLATGASKLLRKFLPALLLLLSGAVSAGESILCDDGYCACYYCTTTGPGSCADTGLPMAPCTAAPYPYSCDDFCGSGSPPGCEDLSGAEICSCDVDTGSCEGAPLADADADGIPDSADPHPQMPAPGSPFPDTGSAACEIYSTGASISVADAIGVMPYSSNLYIRPRLLGEYAVVFEIDPLPLELSQICSQESPPEDNFTAIFFEVTTAGIVASTTPRHDPSAHADFCLVAISPVDYFNWRRLSCL